MVGPNASLFWCDANDCIVVKGLDVLGCRWRCRLFLDLDAEVCPHHGVSHEGGCTVVVADNFLPNTVDVSLIYLGFAVWPGFVSVKEGAGFAVLVWSDVFEAEDDFGVSEERFLFLVEGPVVKRPFFGDESFEVLWGWCVHEFCILATVLYVVVP